MLGGYSQACHSAVVVHALSQCEAPVSNPPSVMPAGPPAPRLWKFGIEIKIFQTCSLLLSLCSPDPKAPIHISQCHACPAMPLHTVVLRMRPCAKVLVSNRAGVMPLRAASAHRAFHRDGALPQPNGGNFQLKTKSSRPTSSSHCGHLAQGSDPHPQHQEI